jgi:hypothetical protein
MSSFGYKFLPKTPELIVERRIRLDRYANLAQASQLIVHLVILFYGHAASTTANKRAGKSQKDITAVRTRVARSFSSKLSLGVGRGYGTYGQWMFGLVWAAWLGFLCIVETAPGN